ncbi:BREX system P-loop protein BrxC [Lachnospiraceae bacterium LCP25S3_G4]
MRIYDMFEKKIDRTINGVIKVGQSDNENIEKELDEYVVTSELYKHFMEFFHSYRRGTEGHTDKMGVWISGFFGSGKSHFLKILSYLLENKHINGRNAFDYFLEDGKIKDQKLLDEIKAVEQFCDDTDVILFNIDSKSSADAKTSKTAIVEVFMKVFNEKLGYCGSIPFLADLERKIDSEGRFDEFKTKFEEINGDNWEKAREDFFFIQDEIVDTLVAMNFMSEEAARNWCETAQNAYALSIDQFAEYVRRYCESKGRNHHVVFMVDEIGQYIADNSNLMLNLQTVTEDLGTACGGRAWIVVTSQQDIDSITKTFSENFSKIQGRFDTRLAMSSANVDEVIRKRILAKKDECKGMLHRLYDGNEAVLKNTLTFKESSEMKLYKDANDFAETYPFIPYQFRLLGHVLTAIRQFGASGKHLAEGERSMLALFKEAAEDVMNAEEDILISFNLFYKALDKFIDHTHRIVIIHAADNEHLQSFDVEILKVLFMIKYVDKLPANIENLTTLMVGRIDEDRIELQKKVLESLNRLYGEKLIQKNGTKYVFLTNEEQDIEKAIRTESVDTGEVINQVAMVIFEDIYKDKKYRYNNRYQFAFNQKVDDRFYKNNQSNGIGLHIMTAYSGENSDLGYGMLSAQEKSVVIRMCDDYNFLEEITEMLQITKFLNKATIGSTASYDTIRSGKQEERRAKVDMIHNHIRMSLENAEIYVNGSKAQIKSRDASTRIDEAMEKLVNFEYSKLEYMETAPVLSDIDSVLHVHKAQLTLDVGDAGIPNKQAMDEVLKVIDYAYAKHMKMSLKSLMDKFMMPPYGYIAEDVEYLVATLYRQAKVALKLNGTEVNPANTKAEDTLRYLTKKDYAEKILLEMKSVPQPSWIKAVKDIMREFVGVSATTDDSDALMKDFITYTGNKRTALNNYLDKEYKINIDYPGKSFIEEAIKLIDSLLCIADPMTFYKKAFDLQDEFLDLGDEIEDTTAFFKGEQVKLFSKAYDLLIIYDKSKNFISDIALEELAKKMKEIVFAKKPYSMINGLIDMCDQFIALNSKMLESTALRYKPDVYDDRKFVMESVYQDRPYTDKVTRKFEAAFDELLAKLDTSNDVSEIMLVQKESNAVRTNCLNELDREEAAYQRIIEKPVSPVDPVAPKPPVKTVTTKNISVRDLTFGKTYSVKSKDDVEKFIEDIRQSLMQQLDEDTIIKLS